MASDYESIRLVNETKYGTEVGRICKILMADRYDDRTHFIYELLQNADDALARRSGWNGSRAVHFYLYPDVLYVSHFGHPFDEPDVRSICGIAESTKEETAIGRFGIGFKSVYVFTDRPEIHSGDEDFAIETFVWPTAVPPLTERDSDATVFVLPLNVETETAAGEITRGFRQLGPKALLFLRQIEEIEWQVESGPSGFYLRSKPELIDDGVRRVKVIGQEEGKPELEESWLIFSRQVIDSMASPRGYVEIGFSLDVGEDDSLWSIKPIRSSPLVVYFPTILETNLGVLLQGPYITTPSRDNVLRSHPWNQHLVRETAALLIQALLWLRDHKLLDVPSLYCLPLDRAKFSEDNMFAPLFEILRDALKSEALLPRFGGGYVCANQSRLARTQELRELFSSQQLAAIFNSHEVLSWLSSEITQDRNPELRRYLMSELGIGEVTPETIMPRLDKSFLEAQADEWITRLYEFLGNQRGLRLLAERLPLMRLEDGTHVPAYKDETLQVFLPSSHQTGFPTIRRAVCASEKAQAFLQSLGIKEPDPVDDVIQNVLPKYSTQDVDVDETTYEMDIRRILDAFKTDSNTQRSRLIDVLRKSYFVMAIDAGSGVGSREVPSSLYLPTGRLSELFSGVAGVLFADHSKSYLLHSDIIEMLKACGSSEYLKPVSVYRDMSLEERAALRRAAGCEDRTSDYTPTDRILRGLTPLLEALPGFPPEIRSQKAQLLWRALCDLEEDAGSRAFLGTYRWHYYRPRQCSFDAGFIQELNETAWIADDEGNLDKPGFVDFEILGWESNAFLQSKIRFKSSEVDALAREAGFDPGCLDFLKKNGITTQKQAEQLVALLQRSTRDEGSEIVPSIGENEGAFENYDPGGARCQPRLGRFEEQHTERSVEQVDRSSSKGLSHSGRETQPAAIGSARDQSRRFISYVGVYPDEEPDPDELETEERRKVEEHAIALVLAHEPELCRTPVNNPGYDLFELDNEGTPIRWVEVKAMTSGLHDRPVGMSSAQFECARQRGDAFWLYVVEYTLDPNRSRIVKIQDPAYRARTFTFDRGWLDVAIIDVR